MVPVIGEAYWDEFAPIADEWAFDQEERKRKPTGRKVLDASGNWAKMPIVMITNAPRARPCALDGRKPSATSTPRKKWIAWPRT